MRVTPPTPVQCPISDVASAATRTSATPELCDERSQRAERRGHCLGCLRRRRENNARGLFPFATLHLQAIESKDSEAKADAQGFVSSTSKGITGGIFHEGQRRRGSAGSDSGTTTLGDRCDCSRTPLHAGSWADCGPEPPSGRRFGALGGR